jgi:hypothetical protein
MTTETYKGFEHFVEANASSGGGLQKAFKGWVRGYAEKSLNVHTKQGLIKRSCKLRDRLPKEVQGIGTMVDPLFERGAYQVSVEETKLVNFGFS